MAQYYSHHLEEADKLVRKAKKHGVKIKGSALRLAHRAAQREADTALTSKQRAVVKHYRGKGVKTAPMEKALNPLARIRRVEQASKLARKVGSRAMRKIPVIGAFLGAAGLASDAYAGYKAMTKKKDK